MGRRSKKKHSIVSYDAETVEDIQKLGGDGALLCCWAKRCFFCFLITSFLPGYVIAQVYIVGFFYFPLVKIVQGYLDKYVAIYCRISPYLQYIEDFPFTAKQVRRDAIDLIFHQYKLNSIAFLILYVLLIFGVATGGAGLILLPFAYYILNSIFHLFSIDEKSGVYICKPRCLKRLKELDFWHKHVNDIITKIEIEIMHRNLSYYPTTPFNNPNLNFSVDEVDDESDYEDYSDESDYDYYEDDEPPITYK